VPSTSARGAYRARTGERREPRITVWLTPTEWATVSAAAARAGMAPGALAAQTLLDAAEYRVMTLPEMRRQMVVALMQAAAHVSRIDANLDQAVADLKASGVPGPDLEAAARQGAQVIRLVEEAAQLIRRRLR
jgi:hypothetical protein